MIIERPEQYNIIISDEEEEIIGRCMELLHDIKDAMEKRDCNHLEWEEAGSTVSAVVISETISILDTLCYVNVMF